MNSDDAPVGRILTRREAVQLITGSTALLPFARAERLFAELSQGAAGMPGCIVRPEQTEGPYFVDQQLNRSDIRTEPGTGVVSPGQLLTLALTVSDVTGGQCRPLPGAMVDVWQCDAKGVYSGVNDPGFDTSGQKFLRGVQATDASGVVRFTTIYPGWYSGRAIHIHFKIRTKAAAGAYEFTSQWYFDDALSDRILADPRYAHSGKRTYNASDGIFRNGGTQLMLAPTPAANGMAATFGIGLDLADSATGRADGMGAGRGRGRPAGPPPAGPRGGRF